jgi:hypothetical protein
MVPNPGAVCCGVFRRRWLLTLCIACSGAVAHAQMTQIERQRLVSHLQMTSDLLVEEITGLSAKQLAFTPSPEQWSIAQVIDHLLVVGPIYWNDLQAALKSPSKQQSEFSDADILWYGIDRVNREKAIPSEVPAGKFRDLAAALAEYQKHHARLIDFIKTTKQDLRGHFVPRQGSDAYQWALLISTHEQRHLLQIREIKAAKGYPR